VTQWTVALKNFVKLDGAKISAGKYSIGNEVALDDPNDAWPEMTEVSSIVHTTIEAGTLPIDITADQFRY
jgi:hypothetical protein